MPSRARAWVVAGLLITGALGLVSIQAAAVCFPTFERDLDAIRVSRGGNELPNAWLGGWTNPRPQLVDIDGDGDLDLFVAEDDGQLRFYRNDGTAALADFVFQTDDYAGVHDRYFARFADLDADGDYDLVVEAPPFGETTFRTGAFVYTNTGTPAVPVYQNLSPDPDGYLLDENGDRLPIVLTSPDFVDLEGDGDLDLIFGEINGGVVLYRNVGTPRVPRFRFETEEYQGIRIVNGSCGARSPPPTRARHGFMLFTFFDIDDDGAPDMFVGDQNVTNSYFFSNAGGSPSPDFECMTDVYFRGEDGQPAAFGIQLVSTFGDLDDDGDADAFFGVGESRTGSLHFYRNEGSAVGPDHVLESDDAFPELDLGEASAIALGDVDRDGDLDLVVGCGSAQTVAYYENVGTPAAAEFEWAWDRPFGGGTWCAPELADLDGDGDLDLFVGRGRAVHFLRNEAAQPGPPTFVEVLGDRDFGAAASTFQTHLDAEATPRFFDEDGDGDLDLLLGSFAFDLRATLAFFRNDGSPSAHAFAFVTDDYQGLGVFDTSVNAAPMDLDADGDLDLVLGGDDGRLAFARNVGAPGAPQFVLETSDLGGIDVGKDAVPIFADIDDDGDADLFVGERGGGLNFYRNVTVPFASPTAFALVEPLPDAAVGASRVRFDWESSFDPDSGDEATYEFRLARSPQSAPSTWFVISDVGVSELFLSVTEALGSDGIRPHIARSTSNAYWTVVARNHCQEAPIPQWRGVLADLEAPTLGGMSFAIRATFPSPSRGAATISYLLPRSGRVRIAVYDPLGRRVRTLLGEEQAGGAHEVVWDGTGRGRTSVASGLYFVRVEFENEVRTARVVLVR